MVSSNSSVSAVLMPGRIGVKIAKLMVSCRFRFPIIILVLLTGCISSAAAQKISKPSESPYRLVVDVDLVSVLATVTTPEGALVAGLTMEDFQVFENGQPQSIAVFGKELDQPLRLCLLFDSSVSIATEVKVEREAAVEFLRSILRPVDRVSVFQVSDDVEELIQGENQVERIASVIRSIKPRGGTSLYDAVYLASEKLSKMQGRKVIVVISDGADTTSQLRMKDCLKMCQNSEAVLYSLVVQPIKSEPGRNLGGEHAMIFLSEKTGGKFFKVSTPDSYRSSFDQISEELRTQYFLAYYPKRKPNDEEYHRIEVRVSNPAYQVRAREGYFSR